MAFAQFQFRRDTAANWTTADPILAEGEIGLELDTDQFKIGDGTSQWSALAYGGLQGEQGIQGIQGISAYAVAVAEGFVGTEAEWLTSLIGPQGATGSVSSATGLTLDHTTTPADPGAGKTAVYAKSDGLIYKLAAGGVEEAIGTGGGTVSTIDIYRYSGGV